MTKFITFLIGLLLSINACAQSTSGGEVISEVISDSLYYKYNWSVDPGGEPLPGVVTCSGGLTCFVNFMPRAGVGPSKYLCDGGGICNAEGAIMNGTPYITVRANEKWSVALDAWVSKYGTSGTTYTHAAYYYSSRENDMAWGKLCVGFAALPMKGTAIAELSPNTTCSLIPPPELQCNIELGSEIDLGTVTIGTRDAQGSTTGSYTCSDESATISASLITPSPNIGGAPLVMSINGITLQQARTDIAKGMNGELRLDAKVDGTLDKAGDYSSPVVIMVEYY